METNPTQLSDDISDDPLIQRPPVSDDEALSKVRSELAQVGAEHALATLRLLMSNAKDEKVRVKAAEIVLEAAGLKGKSPQSIGFNFNVPREHFSRVLQGLGKLGKAKIRDVTRPQDTL